MSCIRRQVTATKGDITASKRTSSAIGMKVLMFQDTCRSPVAVCWPDDKIAQSTNAPPCGHDLKKQNTLRNKF
ncbi:MAG: hypothetical protein AAFN17_06400, partial [Pseudomonadota bacterium]